MHYHPPSKNIGGMHPPIPPGMYAFDLWERHLAGFFHLGVADGWLATPKRARLAH